MSLVWVLGGVLVVLLVASSVAGAHAGGHGLVLPLVSLAFLAGWVAAAAGRGAGSALAWWLAGAAAASAVLGAALALPVLRYRRMGPGLGPVPAPGADGVAVTSLRPRGVVRVGGETWSADSVSGAVPPGAPVHVVSASGVRLYVWSEAGSGAGQVGAGGPSGSAGARGEEGQCSSASS